MKDIKYIAYYSDPDLSKDRRTAPSADTKLDYIISALKREDYNVEVVSKCGRGKCDRVLKKYSDYQAEKNGTPIHFVSDITSRFRPVRFLTRWINKYDICRIIKEECLNNDCQIIIYHSLGMYDIIKFLKKHHKSFVLEVEEIYADVMRKKKRQNRKKEDFMFSAAGSYIFSTELLNKKINTENKPYIVCNGTYAVEDSFVEEKKVDAGATIHCVYAGTLDPRKGGAAAAAAAAAFLPANYHIHILGFGTDSEVAFMKEHIKATAEKAKAVVSYDGLLTGDDYIKFIQSCHIGLSTQDPTAAFNATSFPSKILSYMSNGLRVVSVRIPAIETSSIGEYMYYYDRQTPQEIAEAIMKVDINDAYDSRKILLGLDAHFKKELKCLLEN